VYKVSLFVDLIHKADFYVDGVLSDSNSYTSTGVNLDFIVGSIQGTSNWFNGSIDEILIYNRSFSQSEITSLYNNYTENSKGIQRTGTPSTDGLVLDINFDDYSVQDNSGNENHGTNTNVSFGVVEDNTRFLIEGLDYTIDKTTGLFTIINDAYQWSGLTSSWVYVTVIGGTCAFNTVINGTATAFGLGLLAIISFIGIIGTFVGLRWLLKAINGNGKNDSIINIAA